MIQPKVNSYCHAQLEHAKTDYKDMNSEVDYGSCEKTILLREGRTQTENNEGFSKWRPAVVMVLTLACAALLVSFFKKAEVNTPTMRPGIVSMPLAMLGASSGDSNCKKVENSNHWAHWCAADWHTVSTGCQNGQVAEWGNCYNSNDKIIRSDSDVTSGNTGFWCKFASNTASCVTATIFASIWCRDKACTDDPNNPGTDCVHVSESDHRTDMCAGAKMGVTAVCPPGYVADHSTCDNTNHPKFKTISTDTGATPGAISKAGCLSKNTWSGCYTNTVTINLWCSRPKCADT